MGTYYVLNTEVRTRLRLLHVQHLPDPCGFWYSRSFHTALQRAVSTNCILLSC